MLIYLPEECSDTMQKIYGPCIQGFKKSLLHYYSFVHILKKYTIIIIDQIEAEIG